MGAGRVMGKPSFLPSLAGLGRRRRTHPPLKRWAIFYRPLGWGNGGRSVINRANGCGTGHGQAEFSAVPDGTYTVAASRPTVETVGYFLSPAGLGKGGRSVINRANGCGTGHGQAEFSAVPDGTYTVAASRPTVETVGYCLS